MLPYTGIHAQTTLLRGEGWEGADEAAGDDQAPCMCVGERESECVCTCILHMSLRIKTEGVSLGFSLGLFWI